MPTPPHTLACVDAVDPPTDEEIATALKQLKDTAPGRDGMRARGLRAVPFELVAELLRESWQTGTLPGAFREAVLVANKTGATAWTDHRGITLLPLPAKLLPRVMLNRLKDVSLLDVQHGFRSGNSTADAIMTLESLMDEAQRCGAPLTCCFAGLKAARFPGTRRDRRVGAGGRLIRLLKSLYDDRMFVRLEGATSETAFTSTLGVKQGCLLSPLLFNLVFDRVLRTILPQLDGVELTDGGADRVG